MYINYNADNYVFLYFFNFIYTFYEKRILLLYNCIFDVLIFSFITKFLTQNIFGLSMKFYVSISIYSQDLNNCMG